MVTDEDREKLKQALNEEDIVDFDKVWESAAEFNPPKGKSLEDRWATLENEIDDTSGVVPLYRSPTFFKALGAFAAASVLFALLYLLKPADTVFDQVHSTALADNQEITLPDGSSIRLNADSEIRYSSEKWNKDRSILLNGEAFFDVVKSDIPFRVVVGGSEVTVLGTSFNIIQREEEMVVACATGKVSVASDNENVIITRGLASKVRSGHAPSPPYEVDIDLIGSWINGDFHYNNSSLTQVFNEIERQYDVSINSNLDFDPIQFTGYFNNKDLEKSLSIVCLTAGLTFEIDGKEVTIY